VAHRLFRLLLQSLNLQPGREFRLGFDITGIEAQDSPERVTAFVHERQMSWPETLESDSGPISTLYRVRGWPTAYLVGPDGKFLEANYLGEVKLAEQLARAFPEK